jgi:hypothetical protein
VKKSLVSGYSAMNQSFTTENILENWPIVAPVIDVK